MPCLRSLEQHRDQQRQGREAAGTGWKDNGYVFTRPNGGDDPPRYAVPVR